MCFQQFNVKAKVSDCSCINKIIWLASGNLFFLNVTYCWPNATLYCNNGNKWGLTFWGILIGRMFQRN